jgi:saccharopine dehydrogenase (NAD+, L-lysine-forming)
MAASIGIRREDKSEWERRIPIVPQDAVQLQAQGIRVIVQPSTTRAFSQDEFVQAGITIQEDLSSCPAILGIKEIPKEFFEAGKAYVFFAHVIKGQPYNMAMLQRMLDLGCTLIDYERVVDEKNRRLIFFGWHAGVAGMINTLWALGQRLAWEGIPTPLADLRQTHTYRDLAEAKAALARVRARIEGEGLPEQVTPLIIGIAGYGNVSRGAQEMLDLLPVIEIEPDEIAAVAANPEYSRHHLYKAVFKEWHMVEPIAPDLSFELQDYYDHPERYRSTFERYLPYLTVLVNAIFWTDRYPRLVTTDYLRTVFGREARLPLRVIGDISCDVEGAIECTVKSTEPGEPMYVYNPITHEVTDGHRGDGIVIMAVEILPSELPREASTDFSHVLKPFIPAIARCDYSLPFDKCDLPPEIKRAAIVYQGELTPAYEYIRQYLE